MLLMLLPFYVSSRVLYYENGAASSRPSEQFGALQHYLRINYSVMCGSYCQAFP